MAPRIVLLSTGGTIAAGAADRAATTGYSLDDGPAPDALLHAVPELARLADIRAVAVCRISSADAAMPFMLDLARRIAALLAQDDVDGVVVTHGTDTLEETAWFLHLTVRSSKPIVLTGAMRPGTALGADGPMNLLAAVSAAAAAEARGHGVLVVLNDRIHSARLVRKAHTTAPDAFTGGEIGTAMAGAIRVLARPEGRHTTRSAFDALRLPDRLPAVVLLPAYAELPPAMLHLAAEGAGGLVLACTGNGSLPASLVPAVEALLAAGLAVVRSTRTLGGAVTWETLPGLRSGIHSPQKSRILLALALTLTRDAGAIQAIFDDH